MKLLNKNQKSSYRKKKSQKKQKKMKYISQNKNNKNSLNVKRTQNVRKKQINNKPNKRNNDHYKALWNFKNWLMIDSLLIIYKQTINLLQTVNQIFFIFTPMQSKFTKSKTQLLDWLNQYFTNYYSLSAQNCQQIRSYCKHPLSKIQQLGNGIAYLLLLHSININSVPLRKVQFKPKNQYDNLSNLKLLDVGLGKTGIKKTIDITKLAKMKVQDNLEMLQWFQKYIEQNVQKNGFLTKADTNQTIRTSQNYTYGNKKNDKNSKSNGDYKQSDINNNIQHLDKKMKLAVLQYPQNNQVKPIKIIKEPNPQQLRKKFLQNHRKQLKPITSAFIAVKIQDQQRRKLLPQNNSNTSSSKLQLDIAEKSKKQHNQMQFLLTVNGKRQIQDDYQKQLKRVTVQMNEHKIIDEIADIVYVKNQQKEGNSEKKLAKIQNILLKNGYGGKNITKQNKTNTNNKQKQMTTEKYSQSQRKQQNNSQKMHQQRQVRNQKSPQALSKIQQQNKQQIVVVDSSSSIPQQNAQTKQLQNQVFQHLQNKNEIETALKNHTNSGRIYLETPTFTNENLLMESQEKNVFDNRKSSLKREDLLYLQLQGQQLKLLESKKENNTLLNNSDINKF